MLTQSGGKLRVLHIVGDSRFGGIAQIIAGLGRVAETLGWQAHVLTTDPGVQEFVRREGMGVVALDVIRRPIRPWWDLVGLVRLRHFLRCESYDVVHTHTSKAGFIGRLAASWAGVPVVVHTVHGFAFHEHSPRRAIVFYSLLERIASRWCDRIVTVSEFHRRWATQLRICNLRQVVAIANGARTIDSTSSFNREALRAQLGAQADELLIFTMSRLAPDKGIEYLIQATARLRSGTRKFRIVIAGDGPAHQTLEDMTRDLNVADMVSFLGFRQDTSELLCACDLVVFPSLREGLSIALLEAMAAGKPIIATSIGSVRDLASEGNAFWLVSPADSEELAEAIRIVGSDRGLMRCLGSGAGRLFRSRYTEDRMLSEYRRLYLDLVQRKMPSARDLPTAASSHERFDSSELHGVRAANAADLAAIVSVHEAAFRDFFLTRLGRSFLHKYYELVLNYPQGIVLALEKEGVIQGFVCGFLNPAAFYRLMWRNRARFVLPAIWSLFRRPALARGIVSGIRRIQTSAAQAAPNTCELSSIAVLPEASGHGIGVSLMRAFLSRSWAMNAKRVSLVTDAERNDAANRLYRVAGLSVVRRFVQRKGRWMNEYLITRPATDDRQGVAE